MTVQEIKDWYKSECDKEIPKGWDISCSECLSFIANDCYYAGCNNTKERYLNNIREWVEENKSPILASETDDTVVGYSILVNSLLEWIKSMEE